MESINSIMSYEGSASAVAGLELGSTATTATESSNSFNRSFGTTSSVVTIPNAFDSDYDDESASEYIYGRWDVRAIFLAIYSVVFFACFFGNLMVILVVTLHWRMRSITNFCLANLAFADLCVAIFCIYQNLYMYIMSSWVFGAFLCKMYFFITELSHTASILILVVICIERYLAIIHPMQCKEWLTLSRLRLAIIGVWGLSAIYSSPKLIFSDIHLHSFGGMEEILCIPIRTSYDSKTYDMMNMGILFILPLAVITVLYTRIGIVLWMSSRGQMSSTPPNSAIPVYNTSNMSGRAGPENGMNDANEPSTSSSNGDAIGNDGPVKKQVSCTEILCCGCTSGRFRKCFCRILKRKPSSPQKLRMITYSNGKNEKDNNSLQNYFCPSSNPSSNATAAPHELANNVSNGKNTEPTPPEKPYIGILKTSRAYSYSNSSSSSSASSSCLSQQHEAKISSTEPIVVVTFDNTSVKHKKHGRGKKSNRARCTILMKASTEQLDQSQTECPLLDNGGIQHDENTLTTSNLCPPKESPVISSKRNSVVWNDSINIECGGSSTSPNNRSYSNMNSNGCPPNGNLIRNWNNNNMRNTGSPNNNNGRIRRMRVIRSCTYGTRALKSRRRVIRMLVIIVLVFAVCNSPFHARKMWQYYGSSYYGGSTFSSLFTPITFLIMYMNSAMNPILYAFLSKKFRLSFWDLLTCRIRRSLHIARTASVRSTHVVPLSTAVP